MSAVVLATLATIFSTASADRNSIWQELKTRISLIKPVSVTGGQVFSYRVSELTKGAFFLTVFEGEVKKREAAVIWIQFSNIRSFRNYGKLRPDQPQVSIELKLPAKAYNRSTKRWETRFYAPNNLAESIYCSSKQEAFRLSLLFTDLWKHSGLQNSDSGARGDRSEKVKWDVSTGLRIAYASRLAPTTPQVRAFVTELTQLVANHSREVGPRGITTLSISKVSEEGFTLNEDYRSFTAPLIHTPTYVPWDAIIGVQVKADRAKNRPQYVCLMTNRPIYRYRFGTLGNSIEEFTHVDIHVNSSTIANTIAQRFSQILTLRGNQIPVKPAD